jgi:hypothetical protein
MTMCNLSTLGKERMWRERQTNREREKYPSKRGRGGY